MLNSLRVHHTSKDSKHNSEEEEKERLIIKLEEEWLFRIKPNLPHQNTDLLSERPTPKSFAK